MSSNSSNPAIINPDTPSAFLTPEAAYQTTVSLYVLSGSLAVLCWDIVDNVSNDYKLLFKNKLSLTTAVYFISRLGTLVYAVSAAIFETAPTSANCRVFDRATNAFNTVADSSSTLLFFFRVRAIYNQNPRVVFFFFVLWIVLLGTSFTGPIGVIGANVGQTKYCEDAFAPIYVLSSIIMAVVYDTLVFLAISWRLAKNAHVEMGGIRGGIKVVLLGKYLSLFSKSLLKDGQMYYLLTTISAFLTIIFTSIKSVPVPLSTVFATPTLMLTNIMACRVYRNTRFGLFREDEISTTSMITRDIPVFAQAQQRSEGSSSDDYRIAGVNVSLKSQAQHRPEGSTSDVHRTGAVDVSLKSPQLSQTEDKDEEAVDSEKVRC